MDINENVLKSVPYSTWEQMEIAVLQERGFLNTEVYYFLRF
jgi:hypothetical protein